jgi:hypothetical protein
MKRKLEVVNREDYLSDLQRLKLLITEHDPENVNNKSEIKNIREKYKSDIHFFDENNVSLPSFAIKNLKVEIYEFLVEYKVFIGFNENLEEIKKQIRSQLDDSSYEVFVKKFEQINDKFKVPLPNEHISLLLFKSRCAHDEQKSEEAEEMFKFAFNLLNQIPEAKIIMQIVAAHENFSITFDFNRVSTELLDWDTDAKTLGIIHVDEMKIFVGAKNLRSENESLKLEAIGTLIHELTHAAIQIIYRNYPAHPYALGDEASENEFGKIVVICETKKHKEEIIERVYKYDRSLYHIELIVRVPQILAHYQNQIDKIDQLREDFKELFGYFNGITIPAMQNSLSMIRKMNLQSNEVEWNDLTDDFKMTILNSELNIHGKKSTLKTLQIHEALESIKTTKLINEIIDKKLIINPRISIKDGFYFERKFLNKSFPNTKFESFEEIGTNSDLILLSDNPGTGKSTTFKNSCLKLQKSPRNKLKWISCVNLHDHVNIFEEMKVKTEHFIEILRKILKLNNFEGKIFKEVVEKGGIILFWDGFDEIAPNYKNEVIQLIESIKSNLINCQQWISTRIEHENELELKLSAKVFMHRPLDENDQKEFLENFAMEYKNLSNDKEIQDFVEKCMKIVEKIGTMRGLGNPLVLTMIAEADFSSIKASDEILKIFNLASLYENFIEKKFKEVPEEKGPIVKQDDQQLMRRRKGKVDLWEVHMFYAMKNYGIKIWDHMEILNRKITWDVKKIFRYGLIFPNENETSGIEFVHKTYEEFFVATYVIEEILNCKTFLSEEECRERLKFLIVLAFNTYGFVTKNFILNLAENESNNFSEIDNSLYQFFNKNLNSFLTQYLLHDYPFNGFFKLHGHDSIPQALSFLSNIFYKNQTLLYNFWLPKDANDSLFHKVIKSSIIKSTYDFKTFKDMKKLVTEKFADKETQNAILQGKNQRGVICWYFWNYYNKIPGNWMAEIKELMGFEIDENLVYKKTVFPFYKFSVEEQTEIHSKNFVEIFRNVFKFRNSLEKSQNYFEILENFFRNDQIMLKKVLSGVDGFHKYNLFHFIPHFHNVETFNFITEKYKKIFSNDSTAIKNLLLQRNIIRLTPLHYIAGKIGNQDILDLFYNFSKIYIDEEDILLQIYQNSYNL